jgi:hypothetical protein
MQYMLIHVMPMDFDHGEAVPPEIEESMTAFFEDTARPGSELHGARIRLASDATTLRSRNGEVLLSDGPFAETKEQIVGYDVIECEDLDEAVGWASKHPTVHFGGTIEVRPFLESQPPAPLPEPKDGAVRYMAFVCLGEDFQMSAQDAAEIGPATDLWVKEMDGRGIRLFGNQLGQPDQARTVRGEGAQLLVTDGPFAETKEQIAGFDILECADLDEALEVAAEHPMAKFGMLELRPFWYPKQP